MAATTKAHTSRRGDPRTHWGADAPRQNGPEGGIRRHMVCNGVCFSPRTTATTPPNGGKDQLTLEKDLHHVWRGALLLPSGRVGAPPLADDIPPHLTPSWPFGRGACRGSSPVKVFTYASPEHSKINTQPVSTQTPTVKAAKKKRHSRSLRLLQNNIRLRKHPPAEVRHDIHPQGARCGACKRHAARTQTNPGGAQKVLEAFCLRIICLYPRFRDAVVHQQLLVHVKALVRQTAGSRGARNVGGGG